MGGMKGQRMAKGPQGQTRPADVIGCAIAVARIATGEADDDQYTVAARRRSGLAGAKARSDRLPPERRVEIAKKAAAGRWG